jgi:valyl-tRNA synthetase
MGHALRATIEDVLTRYHRMNGFNTLWQPGIDHAGIATQTVVERQLAREGLTRQGLGREAFLARMWKWKAESGGTISRQQRVLGASPDWPRTKFTLDPELNVAVVEAFVRMYEDGLIYRATRLINWCPECMTALSDLEVESQEGANGELFEFAYKLDGSGDEIVVATTRPETMLGDTAVAVHPDDPRYTHLHGKSLVHPFVDRKIPVITDAILVDPKFGTGAVKVTPAHDFNDFATGKRHGLAEINILALDGSLNAEGGPFAGFDRKRARTAVKRALEDKGLARGVKPHTLTLPRCSRSGGIVEPMISTQWFCKTKEMAEAALAAVRDGRTVILPEDHAKTYNHFLSNIEEWCISRQLWWGHQIPAWHGPNGEIRVARTRPPECGDGWTQDPDVLDTWFSSGLWPFSTLGWPAKTAALAKFYPASDLETGHDILFFWVARMMMMGLHFMGEVPFRRVLLHGMVVDETGKKMSKVLGNVIDPLDLIYGAKPDEIAAHASPGVPTKEALDKFKKSYPSIAADIEKGIGFPAFGTDAVRFTLATYAPSNRRIPLAPKRIEGNRRFANKLWNATRLVTDSLQGGVTLDGVPEAGTLFDRWILAQLHHAIEIANRGISEFRIDEAANELYRFLWTDFCDWYLEATKPAFRAGTGPRVVIAHVLETSLRLLHPMMPFVTEELWQRVPRPASRRASIAWGPYPTLADAREDEVAMRDMAIFKAVVSTVRSIRAEHEVKASAEIQLAIAASGESTRQLLRDHVDAIQFLCRAPKPMFGDIDPRGSAGDVVTAFDGPIEVRVVLKGLITKDQELARISRVLGRLDKDLAVADKKLGSPAFVDKAPKELVDEVRATREQTLAARARLERSRAVAEEL